MGAILRKYGVQTTLLFPLVDAGAQDFEATPVTHASGDTQISKDEGAFANTTNAFAHEGNGIYSLVLSATEMQAARIVVTVIDQSTKAWEDQAILIETYGNASAQHALDLDDGVRAGLTALPNAAADAAGGLPVSDAGGLDLDTLLGRLDAAVSTRSSHAASAVWAVVLENSKTAAQIARGMWALLRGKTSGLTAGVGTVAYRDDADSKDRITGTVDADGNRTGVTIADLD